MIIRLKKANFSANNIGLLDTYSIKIYGTGLASENLPSTVKKDTVLTGTLTLNSGFTTSDIKITMKGTDITSQCDITSSGTIVTITTPAVTGKIEILVGEASSGGGVVVALTAGNKTYSDTKNHLAVPQVVGSSLVKSSQGTKGIYGWDIPKYALVTVKVSGGGNYGMAITDTNDIVIEGFANSAVATTADAQGEYTFAPLIADGKLYVSTTKFVSASYVILSEEELSAYAFPIIMTLQSDNTKYISTSQTVGSAVKLADMGGTGYYISDTIPANSTVKIKVVSGGNYGMVLADVNGNVLESRPSNTADSEGNITFTIQSVETKLYASKSKYTSGTYQLGG